MSRPRSPRTHDVHRPCASRLSRGLGKAALGVVWTLSLSVSLSVAMTVPAGAQAQPQNAAPYSFVVLGHVRGGEDGPNPKLAELLAKVRALKPTFAVLTGDMIWGDVGINPSRRDTIVREWVHLDSALATLQVPIYRVPGNHDINDLVTRDVYRERYGPLPRAVTIGDTRLLLLASVWVPNDGDTRKMPYFRTTTLDSAHLAFLQQESAKSGFAHTFVFMQDLLWWQPDSTQWWRAVHPMLKAGRVDAVFSGDYGPMKFSTTTRDNVRYFQSSMETTPSVDILRSLPSSRLLSSQFDNFLEVRVDGDSVDVVVHTLAEVSSGMFTPELYRQVQIPKAPEPPVPAWRLVWNLVNSPKRLAVLTVVLLGGCLALYRLGVAAGRRRPS